jgi:hypothetical protein
VQHNPNEMEETNKIGFNEKQGNLNLINGNSRLKIQFKDYQIKLLF